MTTLPLAQLVKPIRTQDDYQACLQEVSALVDMDPAPGTPEGDRLDVMATMVEAYEVKHYPIASDFEYRAAHRH